MFIALSLSCAPPTRPTSAPTHPVLGYTIAPWFLFCDGAVSLTFDANDPAVLRDVVPLLTDRERPIGAAFFVDPDRVQDWAPLQKLADAGYDIAAAAQRDGESRPPRPRLDRAAPARPPLPDDRLPRRRLRGRRRPTLPRRHWRSRPIGRPLVHPRRPPPAQTPPPRQRLGRRPHRCCRRCTRPSHLGHLAYADRGDDFADQVEAILDRHARLWDASIADVTRYVLEGSTARLRELARTDATLTLDLTDRMPDDAVYNHPLSIEIALPAGWAAFDAEQAGRPVWHGVVRGRARFNAVPDSGPITLGKKS